MRSMRDNCRVLVTGGAGYIGSHACKALAEAGYLPVTYDNLSHGHDWGVRWGPLELGDVVGRERLDQVIALHAPSAVMHLAGFAYVGKGMPARARVTAPTQANSCSELLSNIGATR